MSNGYQEAGAAVPVQANVGPGNNKVGGLVPGVLTAAVNASKQL